MKIRDSWFSLGLAVTSTWFVPAFAHACPMCFNGNNQNSQAFVYGSLMLMFVPVTVIGSLLYWAWRRACAQDPERNGSVLPEPPQPSEAAMPQRTEKPALRAVGAVRQR